MAKSKSRKVAPRPNRVAVPANRKAHKGGVRMVNAGGVSTPSSTKNVDEARATAQATFAAQQADEIGSVPRVTKETRGKNTKVTEETADQTATRVAGRKKRAAQIAELPAAQTVVMRQPSTPGALAAGITEASVPVSGTGAGAAPAPVVSTAAGKKVKVRRTTKGRGSVGAPDAANAGATVEIRDREEIARDRASVRSRRGAVTPGKSRADRRAIASSSLSSTSTSTNTRKRGSRKLSKLTSNQIPTPAEKAGGAFTGSGKAPRPEAGDEGLPLTATERHIYFAVKARDADVAKVSSNLETRQIREAAKRGQTAGTQGSKSDTEAAVKAGHITETDAMHISSDYAAEKLVPTTDKYMHSDEAMAHELSHHLGHPASLIHQYVKEKVPGGMKEFRDKVISNKRGEGKLTNWTPTGDAKNPYAPTDWRKSGKVRARRRKGLENRTVDVKTPNKPPEGSLAHHDYIKLQLANYADESPTQKSTTRKRGAHPITGSILSSIMSGKTEHSFISAEGETFTAAPGKRKPRAAAIDTGVTGPQAPKGSTGKAQVYSGAGSAEFDISGGPSDGKVVAPAKFTQVRKPRRPV